MKNEDNELSIKMQDGNIIAGIGCVKPSMFTDELSPSEKKLICSFTPECKQIDGLPIIEKTSSIGTTEMMYDLSVIPVELKIKLLNVLNVFNIDIVKDKQYVDIHNGKTFYGWEFEILRYKNWNIIVSPYYLEKGGTIVDVIPIELYDSIDDKSVINITLTLKQKGE